MKRDQNRKGFTLIEVLMAVLLIAILATIAITQFTNFARDTRNATTKENLGILRNAIQKHFGTMRLRCGVLNNTFPAISDLNSNNISAGGGSGCNVTTVPETTDRYFASGGLPENPWSDRTCTNKRVVVAADATANMTVGANVGTLTDATATGGAPNCGWIYDETSGRIKANSANNGTDSDGSVEAAY